MQGQNNTKKLTAELAAKGSIAAPYCAVTTPTELSGCTEMCYCDIIKVQTTPVCVLN
jgi:hypothetical protein